MHHKPNVRAEYIWIDGQQPTGQLRSKTKILDQEVASLSDIPLWGFDGSSTNQAEGHFSDCQLRPVKFAADPFHEADDVLVLCEVLNNDGSVHPSNTRAHCREIAARYAAQDSWFGIEQEYTLLQNGKPLGWPSAGLPQPQGPYYCGVGGDVAFGREFVDAHTTACLKAGLDIVGTNGEVMLGQWEFQLGPLSALEESDQLWLSRWLLHRVGEDVGVIVSLDPKPVEGDWNGTGAHTNFSTAAMRNPDGGIDAIHQACELLKRRHNDHIAVYGAGNERRLTGRHETCSIHEFRFGISDRGASIRIPMATTQEGCGYLEDRRPAANMDPYRVTAILMETVCGGIASPAQEQTMTSVRQPAVTASV